MTKVRDAAIQFEGVKLGMDHQKNGTYLLKLAVHPDETTFQIFQDGIGSRYGVAMVRLNDIDEPVVTLTDAEEQGKKAVQLAGIMCHEREFQRYLSSETGTAIFGEYECAEALRSILGIGSRADLKEDTVALGAFLKLREEYEKWKEI